MLHKTEQYRDTYHHHKRIAQLPQMAKKKREILL